ncbi:hypothetical protein E2C01_094446 [Portunus trituberculatus]|uniref:Uncharacterized protein n=1 Tax=Portunus trituberculatus TaxID=210409 RepID=A0A5B7JSG4_PORTR|nr:hypothetical protein [Portunus trituberculatus]
MAKLLLRVEIKEGSQPTVLGLLYRPLNATKQINSSLWQELNTTNRYLTGRSIPVQYMDTLKAVCLLHLFCVSALTVIGCVSATAAVPIRQSKVFLTKTRPAPACPPAGGCHINLLHLGDAPQVNLHRPRSPLTVATVSTTATSTVGP